MGQSSNKTSSNTKQQQQHPQQQSLSINPLLQTPFNPPNISPNTLSALLLSHNNNGVMIQKWA